PGPRHPRRARPAARGPPPAAPGAAACGGPPRPPGAAPGGPPPGARRDVLAASEAEVDAQRRQELALAVATLLTLALGALVVVRPATRSAEQLLAEVVASREQLVRAYATTSHEREFGTSLVASLA